MINIRRATLEDASYVFENAKEIYEGGEELMQFIVNQISSGPSWVLIGDHGRVGCLIGYHEFWRGVASAGAVTTKHLDSNPIGFTRAVRRVLSEQSRLNNIHRVEMTVKEDYAAGHRWAKALGFEMEATLKQYGSDRSDYVLYRRLF